MFDNIKTPTINNLLALGNQSGYGVKAHLHILATSPEGVRETVKVTQDIDAFRLEFITLMPHFTMRQVKNNQLHVWYHSEEASAYVGSGDVMDELKEEGYSDIRYSDDGYLLIIDADSVKRLVRKGLLEELGA
jgi:hypothetical protein